MKETRHEYVGDSNAFSCSQTCGKPPNDPVHLSYEEVDLVEMAHLEEMEAARMEADAEC